jgi:hypothetical protein
MWVTSHTHLSGGEAGAIPDWQRGLPLADVDGGSYNSLSCTFKLFAAFRLL